MSASTDFAAWYNLGTPPANDLFLEPQGNVPLSTADPKLAMAAEFIAGTFSTYSWVDILKLIKTDPKFAKTLWNYARILGLVGAQTEW